MQGHIPEPKDPARTDEKILNQYGIAVSKWVKARQRKRGEASLQYLRQGRDFVILATHGKHRFFKEEAKQVQDVRRTPIKHGGYSIGYWHDIDEAHVSVRIEAKRFQQLKDHLLKRAQTDSVNELVGEFGGLSLLPFAPVRQQVLTLGRAINRVRKLAGLECVPLQALVQQCYRRRNGFQDSSQPRVRS